MFGSGYKILEYNCIDSSSCEAKRLICAGEIIDDTLVLAREQTSGNGRHGRSWQSPVGNLYCSIAHKLKCDVQGAAQISFVTATSLGNALVEFIPEDKKLQYKWPNDVLVSGHKLAGILLELVKDQNGESWIIVGVGLNVKSSPNGLDRAVISLNELEVKSISVEDVLEKWLPFFNKSLNLWYKLGFSSIRDVWLSRAYNLGKKITVRLPKEEFFGIFEGITISGELELGTEGGFRRVSSGEVFFREEYVTSN